MRRAIVAVLATALVLGCGRTAMPAPPPPRPVLPLTGLVVVVDPGHGGVDGGTTRAGVAEKSVALAVSLKLAEELRHRGAIVYLTRSEDRSLGGMEKPWSLRRNLIERVQLARSVGAQIFLSIHADSNPGRARGASVLYHKDSTLALPLVETLVAALKETTGRHVRVRTNDQLVLRMLPHIPAATVEVGFLSDPQELRQLVDPAYQARLAAAIADAIVIFRRSPPKPPGTITPAPQPNR